MGIIAGALSGLGAGGMAGAELYGKYAAASSLKDQEAEIQKMRDETLADYQRQRDATQNQAIASENEKNRQSQSQLQSERLTQERSLASDRTGLEQMRLDIAGGQAQEQARHNKAVETIQARTAGSQVASADLDRAIKQIALDNARTVRGLQDQYGKSTDPAEQKQIRERIQLLTGKDNDNYLPVPLKDDLGNVTGYQIFDRKAGVWVTPGAGTQTLDPLGLRNGVPQAAIEALKRDPSLAPQFQQKYRVDPERYLGRSDQGIVATRMSSTEPPETGEGPALDTALANKRSAMNLVKSYGLAKQRQDPAGFKRAKDELTVAQDAEAAARRAYEQSLGLGAARGLIPAP